MTNSIEVSITNARANLSDLVARTRHRREIIFLAARGKPQAALIPHDTARLIEQAGGVDAIHGVLAELLIARPSS